MVWYTVRLRPKIMTQAMQCDLGHVTRPGLCNVTQAMKCDLGHAVWPRQCLVTSAVLWPLLCYASWSQVCVTCVLWCDLGQEEWESNSVNRVELFDCHSNQDMPCYWGLLVCFRPHSVTSVCCDPGLKVWPGLCLVTKLTRPINSTTIIPVKRNQCRIMYPWQCYF